MHAGFRILSRNGAGSAVFLLLTTLFLMVGVDGRCASAEVGKVGELTGNAWVEREGVKQPLKAGDPINAKDMIRTGTGSAIELIFMDESLVKLTEETALEITEYIYSPAEKTRSGLVSLISGKVRLLTNDLQDFREKRFRVQTQTTVVGSRDTDFIVSHQPGTQGKDAGSGAGGFPAEVGCREGLVEAFCITNAITAFSRTSPDKPVLLMTNMVTQICGTSPPAPPRFATPVERSRILGGLEQIGKVTTSATGLPHEKKQDASQFMSDFASGIGGGDSGGGTGGAEDLLPGSARPTNPAFGPTATTLTRRGSPVEITRPTTTSPSTTFRPTIPPTSTTTTSPGGLRRSLPGIK